MRKALSVALSLFLAAVGVFAVASPAHASYQACIVSHSLNFGYIGNTWDGYTGVSQTSSFWLTPSSGGGCDAPYEGRNRTCSTFQLVVVTGRAGNGIYGPWVRSCDTPQKMASGWGGWVSKGDAVFVRTRAEMDGSHNPGGSLFY